MEWINQQKPEASFRSVNSSDVHKLSYLSSGCLQTDSQRFLEKDPFCDPDHPVVVKWEQVEKAMENIKNDIIRTPFKRTRLSDGLEMDLYFKKDYMQYTGSFKDRGSLNALLNLDKSQKFPGVITTSAGNHGQGLAYAGLKLGIPVTVVMPETTPLVKINSCRKLEAIVHLRGQYFDESYRYAMAHKDKNIYINGFDHPDVIAGQGTIAIEMLEEVPDLDYIIVPVGGGGLLAGVSVAVNHMSPKTKIIGVESAVCPSWTQAMMKGYPVMYLKKTEGQIASIADGLSVLRVGHNAFATVGQSLSNIVTVTEDYIAIAILRLLEYEKALVEGAGAIGFAAILAGLLPELKGKKVGCILCGGNIDVSLLGRLVDRALTLEGRLCRVSCSIGDKPGQLAMVSSLIGSTGANVKEVLHDRLALPAEPFRTMLHILVETRGEEHAKELRDLAGRLLGAEVHWEKLTPVSRNNEGSSEV